ncbi:MAG: cellulase N-terminal Ig-like domain-containing protein, partial [Candidatus Brocadiaceae bacterium]
MRKLLRLSDRKDTNVSTVTERYRWSWSSALILAICLFAPALAAEEPRPSLKVVEFRDSFSYTYGDFEGAVTVAEDVAHIRAEAGRGGAAVTGQLDLSPFADHSPGLRMRVGPDNRAERIRLFFEDSDKTRYSYLYGLSEAPTDRCALVLPSRAASMGLPNQGWLPGQPRLDLSDVRLVQIQGNWTGQPVDVYVESVEMVAPTARAEAERRELASQLEARAERERREAERREREKQEALADPQHGEDDPAVTGVCAVAPDVLCVTIQTRQVNSLPQVPYEAHSADEVRESGNEVLAWHHGRIVRTKKDLEVHRDTDGGEETIGWLVINEDKLWPGMQIRGHELTRVTVPEPAAYRISSPDDPRYGTPVRPDGVHVKSKPTDHGPGNELPVRYRVFLRLPHPLQVGSTYRVHFTGLNTRRPVVPYAHIPTRTRSEAIHVSHVGYRPDDPFKRAYLSTWMGTGGALAYAVQTFQLLEASTDRVVYQGPVKLGLDADQPEHLKEERNYTKTNVYHLDFSGFRRPGT